MKIKQYYQIISLSIISVTLASCTSNVINPLIRPADYILDYWIGDRIEPGNLIGENIYQQDIDGFYYLDSKYDFVEDENGNGQLKYPDEYSFYHMVLQKDNYIVSYIYIHDPAIEIYGMNMLTDSNDVHKTFSELGFMFLDKYSGRDPSYLKDEVEFRIYPHYISIELRLFPDYINIG